MELKKCPYCSKSILVNAKTCKYCGKSIEQQEQNVPNQKLIADSKNQLIQYQTIAPPRIGFKYHQPIKPKFNYTKIIIMAAVIVVILITIVITVAPLLNKNETVVSLVDTIVVEKQIIVPQQGTILSKKDTINNNSSPTITVTKTLKGNVGKLSTLFKLTWHQNGRIEGTYYYIKRPNIIYTLEGEDLENGSIRLTEYTENVVTATCNLKLQGKCYDGEMNNTDGRILKMRMCEDFESITDISSKNTHVPGMFPQASLRLLTPSDLIGISKYDLKIMRNEIFARHGYIFKTSEMKSYFSTQSWYHGRYEDVSSLLSDIEHKNVALLKSYE